MPVESPTPCWASDPNSKPSRGPRILAALRTGRWDNEVRLQERNGGAGHTGNVPTHRKKAMTGQFPVAQAATGTVSTTLYYELA